MTTYPECKFYLKGGKCSHCDAPNPNHSYCIDKLTCGARDDNINYQARPEEPKTVETS